MALKKPSDLFGVQKVSQIVEEIDRLETTEDNDNSSSGDLSVSLSAYVIDEIFDKFQERIEKTYISKIQSTHKNDVRGVYEELEKCKKLINTTELRVEGRVSTLKKELCERIDERITHAQQTIKELYHSEITQIKKLSNDIQLVEKYIIKNSNKIIDLKNQINEELQKRPVSIDKIEDKINLVAESYQSLSENLDESLLDNTKFVTSDQLKDHYRLFLNRIQEQLSTLGGGGEVRLQYLDDVVGIATNAAAYDGKFLKYNHSLKKFEFVTVSGGGGGGISLTDLSVTTNPVGTAALSYNNSNGVFTYTPPSFVGYATEGYVDNAVASTNKITQGNTSAEVVDTGFDGHFKVLTEGIERLRIGSTGIVTFTGRLDIDYVNKKLQLGRPLDSSVNAQINLDNQTNGDLQFGAGGFSDGSRGNFIFYKKTSFQNKTAIATLYSDTGNLNISGTLTANSFSGITTSMISDYGNGLGGGGGGLGVGSTSKITQGNTVAEVVDTGSDGHFKVLTEGIERLRIGPTGIVTFTGNVTFAGTNYNMAWDRTGDYLQFDNNAKAIFGSGNNSLLISSNGTNGFIDYSGSGALYIRAIGGQVKVTGTNGNEDIANFIPNDAVELYYDNSKKFETTASGITVTGIVSATSFSGNGNDIVHSTWTLGANGSSHYTFTGPGGLSNTDDPKIYLARGQTYEFVNNSGGSHPFQIQQSNGSTYSTGVTNNGASSGTIRFEVPFSAPNTLQYKCTSHSSMGNTIIVYPDLSP